MIIQYVITCKALGMAENRLFPGAFGGFSGMVKLHKRML